MERTQVISIGSPNFSQMQKNEKEVFFKDSIIIQHIIEWKKKKNQSKIMEVSK